MNVKMVFTRPDSGTTDNELSGGPAARNPIARRIREAMKRIKIVNGGHVNLPQEIAHRWGTRYVSLEDHEDHVVLRPAPDEGTMPEELEEPLHVDDEFASLRRRSSGAGF